MSRIHKDLEYEDFTKPSGITSATVCSRSGLLPIEGVCDADPRGSQLYTEYFAAGTVPTDTCDHHTRVDICTASYLPAGANCPLEQIISSVFIVGAQPGSADSAYSISADQLAATCNVHNAVTTNPDGSVNIQPSSATPIMIPGVNVPIEGANTEGQAATDQGQAADTTQTTTTDSTSTGFAE